MNGPEFTTACETPTPGYMLVTISAKDNMLSKCRDFVITYNGVWLGTLSLPDEILVTSECRFTPEEVERLVVYQARWLVAEYAASETPVRKYLSLPEARRLLKEAAMLLT